jgi:polyisoprenoid-binding protein YceI
MPRLTTLACAGILLAAACLLFAGACLLAQQPTSDATAPASGSGSGRTFNIDPQSSSVTLRVYRAGVLSVLAHDHVLVATGIAGRLTLDEQQPGRSSLQLSVPVASLEIDNPEQRVREKFTTKIGKTDIEKIRAIVMSAEYLDEPNFPRVTITALEVAGALPTLSVGLNVRIKQVDKVYRVPVQVALEGDALHATGELFLLQSDFGMKPYSSLLGAIAVQDPVQIRFEIVAREQH